MTEIISLKVLSSLHKVYPDFCPEITVKSGFSTFKNEPFSFQIAYKAVDGQKIIPFNVKIESELPVSFYSVDYVPVMHTDVEGADCDRTSGLFPDILRPKKTNPKLLEEGFSWSPMQFEDGDDYYLYALNDSWRSMWFTVNEDAKNVKAGDYKITVTLQSKLNGAVIGAASLKLRVLDAALQKQKLIYTNWFHCDCLCDYYGFEPFTDEFWKTVGEYAKVAAKNGMNMILTPAFTPALDTPIGKERKTVQLVDVTFENGRYTFGFEKFKKFVDVCRKAGIEYFEHAHLFTQWGAKATPKIMGVKNGKYRRLFGWDVAAWSKAYKEFLEAYIPALKEFLRQEGLEKKIFFHISDEPSENTAESYKKALDTVGSLLDGFAQGDALSHYVFYEKGYVKTPIVVTSAVESFVGKCDNMWCYYTGGEVKDGLSNRLIVMSHERNRILGTQMYAYGIKGFLHWGYNFYYDILSHGISDPKANPGNYRQNPGTSYSVYPEINGQCLQSCRQKVFYEGICDGRALELAEKKCGKSAVEKLIKKHFGKLSFHTAPENPEQMLKFRLDLNKMIEKQI